MVVVQEDSDQDTTMKSEEESGEHPGFKGPVSSAALHSLQAEGLSDA